MGENSAIQWTNHTFNPWVGCSKVSPACDHCYAEAWAKRAGSPQLWQGSRRRTSVSNWKKPGQWNARAEREGRRERVFCASLADVFDNAVPELWRADLFALIRDTRHLDWLLLTKRIGNAWAMSQRAMWDIGMHGGMHHSLPPNVWLGATVVTQAEVERDVPKLLHVPASIRFLSCEPLLERLDLAGALSRVSKIHWIIVGGESGPGARPMDARWCDEIRQDCKHAGAAFFMKQGSAANWEAYDEFSTFPPKLQLREFPA